jgi:hypothetical protein
MPNTWGPFEVIVGNIGSVYSGPSLVEAHRIFDEYVSQSRSGYGRAGGETVTLVLSGGDAIKEFVGVHDLLADFELA